MPTVYSRFYPPPKVDARKPGKEDLGADQSFQKEADINVIMARYKKTGYMTDPSKRATRVATWDDMTNGPGDFMEAQEVILKAQTAFDSLPSQLRGMFQNSPTALLSWLEKEENHGEAVKWGLMAPKVEPLIEEPKAPE